MNRIEREKQTVRKMIGLYCRHHLKQDTMPEEYLREHPDGYKYSTFKRAVRRQKYHVRVVGHVDHLAGDQMYIDYAGDKLEIVDAGRRCGLCWSAVQGAPFQGANLLVSAVNCGSWRCKPAWSAC